MERRPPSVAGGARRCGSVIVNAILPATALLPARLVLLAVMLGLIAIEYLLSRLRRNGAYDGRETLATLVIALGGRLFGGLTAGLLASPLLWIYRHRLLDVPASPWSAAALFLAVELCYYWHHRAMHGVNWLWATHAVHHSASRLNLSAALRLGWGGNLSGGILFYLPLVWLGFPPLAVLAALGLGLSYQFFLHMAWVPHLGPLEWVLNTPRHHHVHHAANGSCRDRNFGSVLVVFDRLFGTYGEAPAEEPLRFGLDGAALSPAQPLQALLVGWRGLSRSLRDAKTSRDRWRALFGAPA